MFKGDKRLERGTVVRATGKSTGVIDPRSALQRLDEHLTLAGASPRLGSFELYHRETRTVRVGLAEGDGEPRLRHGVAALTENMEARGGGIASIQLENCSTIEPGSWKTVMSRLSVPTSAPASPKTPARAEPVPTSMPMK